MIAAAACGMLLFLEPLSTYYLNAHEFTSHPKRIALALLSLAISAFFTLLLARAALRPFPRARSFLRRALIVLAAAAWIQSTLLAWNYQPFNGQEIDWSAHPWRAPVDLIVWGAVAVCAAVGGKGFLRHAGAALLILLLAKGVGVSLLVAGAEPPGNAVRYGVELQDKWNFSPDRNVILLILDSLQSDLFAELVADEPGIREPLDGFVYFPDAVSGFDHTYPSVHYMLSGIPFDNAESMEQFQTVRTRGRSIAETLRARGFRVELYPYLRGTLLFDDRAVSNFRESGGNFSLLVEDVCTLLDVTLFRVSPEPVKRLLHRTSTGKNWLIYSSVRALRRLARARLEGGGSPATPEAESASEPGAVKSPEGAPILPHMLANEQVRFAFEARRAKALPGAPAVFKMFHLQGAHPPHEFDRDFHPARLAFSADSYAEVGRASLRLAGIFLGELKRAGIYDRSLIVIASDHGLDMPIRVTREDLRRAFGFAPPPGPWMSETRRLPLLLVKPFDRAGPLEVSTAPVTLGDIPRTIDALLGHGDIAVGRSLFDPALEPDRPRAFYSLKFSWNERRRKITRTYYGSPSVKIARGFSWLGSSWHDAPESNPPPAAVDPQDPSRDPAGRTFRYRP